MPPRPIRIAAASRAELVHSLPFSFGNRYGVDGSGLEPSMSVAERQFPAGVRANLSGAAPCREQPTPNWDPTRECTHGE
jgi:hypothetical protein